MLKGRPMQVGGLRVSEPISGHDASDLSVGFLLQEMLRAYDLIGVGLGIVDAEGRLLHSNGVADEILARRDGLEVTPSRILRAGARHGAITNELLEPLRQNLAADPEDREQTAVLAVPRPSGKRPLTLLVRFSPSLPSRPDLGGSPSLVFLVDPEVSMKGMEGHVRQVCGFTAAEAQLATLLMQGNSLAECCSEMGIRRPTAATHLRQLFDKTQARTQSQLVSFLFRRCGMLRAEVNAQKSELTGRSVRLVKLQPVISAQSSESFTDSFIRR